MGESTGGIMYCMLTTMSRCCSKVSHTLCCAAIEFLTFSIDTFQIVLHELNSRTVLEWP